MESQLYRPNAAQGLWLAKLIPISLVLSFLRNIEGASGLYALVTVLSLSFLIIDFFPFFKKFEKNFYCVIATYICDVIVVTWLAVNTTPYRMTQCLQLTVWTLCYHPILYKLVAICEKSFTKGEASLVAQSFILFTASVAASFSKLSQRGPPLKDSEKATILIQCLILGALTCAIFLRNFPNFASGLKFYVTLFAIDGLFFILIPRLIIGVEPISWILFDLALKSFGGLCLVFYWLSCVGAASYMIYRQVNARNKANAVARKSFHLLTVAVVIPGLATNSVLTYLATGVAFVALIQMEMIRILNVKPFAIYLQRGYMSFVDEKDSGTLALTPLYLLVGCALPLWLDGNYLEGSGELSLPTLAGVLSVGIGDTAASAFGIWFGKKKWANSKKTYVGSLFAFLSQVVAYLGLTYFGYLREDVFWPIGAMAFVTLVEAKTNQVDNIALPLVLYILFTYRQIKLLFN